MVVIKVSVLSLKEKSTHNWFSYFQIARKYQKPFMTNPLNIMLTSLIYDFSDIVSSLVVYIFHKDIIL